MINNIGSNPVGDLVGMKSSNTRHYGVQPAQAKTDDFLTKFGDSVKEALQDANNMQIQSDRLATQMVRKPDSVNVHDVMIAAQKAQLSLDLTKQVLTRAVQAYQNITNLR